MNDEQFQSMNQCLADIEQAIKDNRRKAFSWWPFWTAGWLFTIMLYGQELVEFLETATVLQKIGAGTVTWLFWPAFLGAWVGELAQLLG